MSTTELNEIKSDFFALIITFIENLKNVAPNTIVSHFADDIIRTFNNKHEQDKIISMFALKVLPFKINIDNKDESFFLEKNYDKETKGEHSDIINNVFNLKEIWQTLSTNDKNIIFDYMIFLTDLASNYFLIKTSKK